MQTDQEFSTVVALPQFPGPSIVTRRNAPADNNEATAATVETMRRAAIEDSDSLPVWLATKNAITGVSADRFERCEAIYKWIASRVRFRSDDPVLQTLLGLDDELDLLIRPARLLTMNRPAEDCDGFTMLACSMLLCAGVPCEIVTIKADPHDPSRFSHVYCQAYTEDGQAIVMDCSQAAQHGFPIGWEAPEFYDRKSWGVMEPVKREGLHGLGCDFAGSGEDCYGASNPADTNTGINWNSLISTIVQGGLQIGKQVTLPPGSYVQTKEGVMANQVPGAIPGQYPATSALNLGGVSSTTLIIGGVIGLGLILALAKK